MEVLFLLKHKFACPTLQSLKVHSIDMVVDVARSEELRKHLRSPGDFTAV